MSIVVFHTLLPSFWVSFIDNQPGRFALLRGYGRDATINRMIAFTWSFVARIGAFPHFHYVASECNVSDGVSRHDFTFAQAMRWRQLDLNLDPLETILSRVAVDLPYAIDQAVDDALIFSKKFRLPRPCGLGRCLGG